jgi:hypothetical protein
MTRTYRTRKEALNAFRLDTGFNPWAVGQVVRGPDGRTYRKPTKAALAAIGYRVSTKNS